MKAAPRFKATILRAFFLVIIFLVSASCKRNSMIENSLKDETFAKNKTEEIETFFLVASANESKFIISKSQIAQQKSSDSIIQELSRRIVNQQNQLQHEISQMANKRLVIITDINAKHKRDLYVLIDADRNDFKDEYLNSVAESLDQQINLFESISKKTNDKTILKLVLQYLPEQYRLLRETEDIKKQNI